MLLALLNVRDVNTTLGKTHEGKFDRLQGPFMSRLIVVVFQLRFIQSWARDFPFVFLPIAFLLPYVALSVTSQCVSGRQTTRSVRTALIISSP